MLFVQTSYIQANRSIHDSRNCGEDEIYDYKVLKTNKPNNERDYGHHYYTSQSRPRLNQIRIM